MPEPLRLVTFNVLHDDVRTPIGPWGERRGLVLELLRAVDADVLCLQEVSARQLPDLVAGLPEFECFAGDESGRTRLPLPFRFFVAPLLRRKLGDFIETGERCPIFLRRGRMRALARGSFPTRDEHRPSDAFGTPYIVNWLNAEDVRSGIRFTAFTTHFGILPKRAARNARRVRRAIAAHEQPGTRILCGDFNSYSWGSTMRSLMSRDHDRGFVDAWRIAERRRGQPATFRLRWVLPDARIDYVLVEPGARVIEAETLTGERDGRRPSDHSALRVDLELPRA